MRFLNKYKNFSNTFSFLKQSSVRILKFKRPKWKKFQAVLKIKSALPSQFINNSILKVNYKVWEKIKSHYKEGIQSKKGLLNLFDNSLSSSYYKKELSSSKKKLLSDFISILLAKPLFKLDILLWKLCVFNSSFESRQAIRNGLVLINNQLCKDTLFLKEGDIISFSDKVNLKRYEFNSRFDASFLFSFLEIDYYSGTIIIIKNFTQLSNEDFSTLIFDSINIKAFHDYINKN
jgi:hypothetical protein